MNLGDGLLFELENGKPRLILLSHGNEKNPAKLSIRPRGANILSPRQPSCVDEVQVDERPVRQQPRRHKESRAKAGGAAPSFSSTTAGGRSTTLVSSRTHEHHNGGSVKAVPKMKLDRHKHGPTVGSLRANQKTGQPQNDGTQTGGKVGLKETPACRDAGLKESMVVLTSEQLQQILNTVQTSSNGQHLGDDQMTQGRGSDGAKCGTSVNEGGGGGEMKEEDRRKGDGGGVADSPETSLDKDNSWLEERQSYSRSAIDAKKAQWKRELDEQVALKQQQQQCSAPSRLQAEEDTESILSVQSSVSHREQPAAIRSSLKLGEITPVEEVSTAEKREEQRRLWLEDLDRQREEKTERKRREKLLQSQAEDHELWATHFDSLQKRPPAHPAAPSAPPPAPSSNSERGDWEPSSSLSLVWEATSSCGAESVGRASVDVTGGPSRAGYLRTMTALLDPTQLEERERRRLKQLEQQRAIEAQMEERRQQREREKARRREEEEEEDRRVALERERLQRQFRLDTLRERPKEQLSHQAEEPQRRQEAPSAVTGPAEHLEEEIDSSVSPYRDTAVQTEDPPTLPLKEDDVSVQHQPPPAPSAAPPNCRSRAARAGKENVCVPGAGAGAGAGADPYEAFARTDRSRRDKRRPDWNTQRPNRRFVPASERYPAALQRNRQESRLKRQAELLALQERTCQSRTDPPPPSDTQTPRLCPTQTRISPRSKVESVSRGQSVSAANKSGRGRSPPAARHSGPTLQTSVPLPPPALEFIPYVRTDEVFNLDPLEPADTPPPHTHTDAPPPPPRSSASPPILSHRDPLLHPEPLCKTHTLRQQEILRGLAQLRQGLLQKQRELEADLNPLLKHPDNGLRSPSATHRM